MNKINRSDTIVKLALALAQVQGRIRPIAADSVVNTGKYQHKYAKMDAIAEDVRPLLTEAGVVLLQVPLSSQGRAEVETMLIHAESGEWLSFTSGFPMPDTAGPQAFGSAFSYLSRYSLRGALWLVFGDDDGEAAQSAFTARNNAGWAGREKMLAQSRAEIAACFDRVSLETWWNNNKDDVNNMDMNTASEIMALVTKRHKEVGEAVSAKPGPKRGDPEPEPAPAEKPSAPVAQAARPVSVPAPSKVQETKAPPPPPPPMEQDAWFADDFLNPGGK